MTFFTRNSAVSTAILLCLSLPLIASEETSDEGETPYKACMACHGAQGEGKPEMNAPSLAGMNKDYLQRQLKHFKGDQRGSATGDTLGAQMKAMTATLATEQSIEAVSSYLASLPVTVSAAAKKVEGDLRKGNNLYQGSCGSCHGNKGEGNARLNTPRLAHQDANYLTRQFDNFKQGLRGQHPDDRYGRQMKMMANVLKSDQDLQDVIAYLQAQNQ